MKIKRIEISGFKSFVDKAVLEFPPGVTAIVGPNGCGKSNIVDAIRWVMGEQSAKNLRGRQMEDIIFGGSESRKPLGMAEVSLVFSTDDGLISAKYLGYSEVQVSRRLYRDGESEYLLNNTPCRLMDIADLFMDTGVGARAYSIIEQGRIGMILMAKPEERRFLIEEAAGVTKFKSRKQTALKKIETTRQNLMRIGDIVSEIRRQLNGLQRQAKKAEKFRLYRDELKEIDLLFAAQSYSDLELERGRSARRYSELKDLELSLSTDLAARELSLETFRINLVELEKELQISHEMVSQLKSELHSVESRREFQQKELSNLERQTVRQNEELQILAQQLAESEAEALSLEVSSGSYGVEAAGEARELEEKELELAALLAVERQLAAMSDESRRSLFSINSEIAQCANNQTSLSRRMEQLAEREDRSRKESAVVGERLIEAVKRVKELENILVSERTAKEALQIRLTELLQREEKLKTDLHDLDKELLTSRDQLSRNASRLNSLRELEAQFAGFDQGVRTLLQEDSFRVRFNGVVADVLETTPEYEVAVESVLANHLQSLVASKVPDIIDAVSYLKDNRGGRCSFILSASESDVSDQSPPGCIRLLDHVMIVEEVKHQIRPLLRDAFIVPDLETAITMAGQYKGLTFVTRDGDLAFNGGCVDAGSSEATQHGLIQKKREIKELAQQVAACDGKVNELIADSLAVKAGLSEIDEALLRGRQELHTLDISLLSQEKDLLRVCEECQRLEDRIAVKDLEDAQTLEERHQLELDIVETQRRCQSAEEKRESLLSEAALAEDNHKNHRHTIEIVRETVTGLKISAAALQEKREANILAIKRNDEVQKSLTSRILRLKEDLARFSEEQERLQLDYTNGEMLQNKLLEDMIKADAASAASREKFDAATSLAKDEEALIRNIRNQLDVLHRNISEASIRLTEINLQRTHLEDTIRDKYRVEMVAIQSLYQSLEIDLSERKARQEELLKMLEEMGEVSLTAIEECKELEERFNFLSIQKADLEESLLSLQQAIQRINRTTRKRFQDTFQQVNAKFKEVFPRLFCGGEAELRLTNEEDMLETGLDIIVQPPGKKLQNVSLLSGGEKALTAVALIFAIFLIKPSPFCLLDEVDAPLDDANIGRFNEMIREMSAFSQFILITHSKTTMAVADTLYGVTMELPGVSKLVSVRLQ